MLIHGFTTLCHVLKTGSIFPCHSRAYYLQRIFYRVPIFFQPERLFTFARIPFVVSLCTLLAPKASRVSKRTAVKWFFEFDFLVKTELIASGGLSFKAFSWSYSLFLFLNWLSLPRSPSLTPHRLSDSNPTLPPANFCVPRCIFPLLQTAMPKQVASELWPLQCPTNCLKEREREETRYRVNALRFQYYLFNTANAPKKQVQRKELSYIFDTFPSAKLWKKCLKKL